MSSLLIIYLTSVAVVGNVCYFTLKNQWEEGIDIDVHDLLAAMAVTLTPVLNSFCVISAVVKFIIQSPVIVKGKEKL